MIVAVLIANGTEDIEVTTVVDILRRAEIEVKLTSVEESLMIECANKMKITADVLINDVCAKSIDAVVLPGGMTGSETFIDSKLVLDLVRSLIEQEKLVAAICAAPLFFAKHSLLADRKITSHPCVKGDIEKVFPNLYQEEKVVVDRKFVTSRGPGTALAFALTIVEELMGKSVREHVQSPLMI